MVVRYEERENREMDQLERKAVFDKYMIEVYRLVSEFFADLYYITSEDGEKLPSHPFDGLTIFDDVDSTMYVLIEKSRSGDNLERLRYETGYSVPPDTICKQYGTSWSAEEAAEHFLKAWLARRQEQREHTESA